MTRYYPQVDADSTGVDKMPLFPTNTIFNAFGKGNYAIAEITPHPSTSSWL